MVHSRTQFPHCVQKSYNYTDYTHGEIQIESEEVKKDKADLFLQVIIFSYGGVLFIQEQKTVVLCSLLEDGVCGIKFELFYGFRWKCSVFLR